MKRIALLDDYQGVGLQSAPWQRLAGRAQVDAIREHIDEPPALAARLAPYHVLVANRERTPIRADLIAALPNLALIVTFGQRNAAIDVQAAAARGIPVCGTPGMGHPTAELTWGLILSLARHLPAEINAMRSGGWQRTVGIGLSGKTLGVLGLGKQGSAVARIGVAFGMDVAVWSRSMTAERAATVGARAAPFDELLQQSDIVSLHLPLNAGTRGLIGARELGLLKPGALLVNTSRGPLVDEAALLDALRQRRLSAALDVFDREPLPDDHPLRSLDNALLTPHLGYVIAENYRGMFGGALEDIEAWLDGKPIRVIAPA
ncbi:MAG: D-2-hydroxyacid dehydrogenase family protein [Burkholderiaceae bacterium]